MLRRLLLSALALFAAPQVFAQAYAPVADKPPGLTREFRGAWIACIYNLDWPSSSGLGAGQQQAELRAMLDKLAALNMNAVIFQVRPELMSRTAKFPEAVPSESSKAAYRPSGETASIGPVTTLVLFGLPMSGVPNCTRAAATAAR